MYVAIHQQTKDKKAEDKVCIILKCVYFICECVCVCVHSNSVRAEHIPVASRRYYSICQHQTQHTFCLKFILLY